MTVGEGVSRPRRRHREEVNFLRLLSKCETMAMDTENLHLNWRFEKYVEALEKMLEEIRTLPGTPDKDTMLDYRRKVDCLQGVLSACKMPSTAEKAVVAGQLIPSSPTSGLDDLGSRSLEIRHRHTTRYAEDLRKELLGGNSPGNAAASSSPGSGGEGEEMEEILKYHQAMQEKIAEQMIELTRNLKDRAQSAGDIIRKDVESLEKTSGLLDRNRDSLKRETEQLEMYNKSACKCWVWVVLFIVCSTFIGMVLFMRLFKKRQY